MCTHDLNLCVLLRKDHQQFSRTSQESKRRLSLEYSVNVSDVQKIYQHQKHVQIGKIIFPLLSPLTVLISKQRRKQEISATFEIFPEIVFKYSSKLCKYTVPIKQKYKKYPGWFYCQVMFLTLLIAVGDRIFQIFCSLGGILLLIPALFIKISIFTDNNVIKSHFWPVSPGQSLPSAFLYVWIPFSV